MAPTEREGFEPPTVGFEILTMKKKQFSVYHLQELKNRVACAAFGVAVIDDGGLWRVGTCESKGFCETKDNNALVTSTLTGSTISTVVFTN